MTSKRDTREWLASCYEGLDPIKGQRATSAWARALAGWVVAPHSPEERSRREQAAANETRNRRCRAHGDDRDDAPGLTPSELREVERMARGEGPAPGSPEGRLRAAAAARRSPPPAPRPKHDEAEAQRARIRRAGDFATANPRRT